MSKLLATFRTNLYLQKAMQILILIAIILIPESIPYSDFYYALLLTLFIYIASFVQVDPIWKGLLLALTVTAIIVGTLLLLITLLPQIPAILLMVIAVIIGVLLSRFF
ncbi:hypothetical protein [Bacillus toyonensis]|uniref:hypothetical protein n=1 Tax=Bacillus toyonensis TaxID=155322 RepID=UPI002E1FA874|nr:hypothetical protein [Bacillus toyonensis]